MIALLAFIDDESDKELFIRIYNENRGEMFNYANYILHDDGLAEDAVHDAFEKVAKYFSKIDFTANTRSLLLTIVRNTALTLRKKYRREIITSAPLDGECEESRDHLETSVENRSTLEDIIREIENMPEEYATVFRLRYIHDLTYSQIAGLLDISVSSAKKRAQRIRNT